MLVLMLVFAERVELECSWDRSGCLNDSRCQRRRRGGPVGAGAQVGRLGTDGGGWRVGLGNNGSPGDHGTARLDQSLGRDGVLEVDEDLDGRSGGEEGHFLNRTVDLENISESLDMGEVCRIL